MQDDLVQSTLNVMSNANNRNKERTLQQFEENIKRMSILEMAYISRNIGAKQKYSCYLVSIINKYRFKK